MTRHQRHHIGNITISGVICTFMDTATIERLWNAVNWLSNQPRGAVAVRVWASLWSETDLTDFRVKADRHWIAAKARTTVGQVSRILTMLEQIGAIRREHERHVRGQQLAIWMTPGFRFPSPSAS